MKKNLLNFSKFLSSAVVLTLVAPVMINAQASRTDFSGTWALNAMESSPSARSISGDFVVKQEANLLTTTTTDKDGMSTVSKYTLDGKESINKTHEVENKAMAKFSADGKTLTILTKFIVEGKEKIDQDVWSLRDPKTLSVVCTTAGMSCDEVTKFVYYKKEWW
jgi:Tol biopolymer transport system component